MRIMTVRPGSRAVLTGTVAATALMLGAGQALAADAGPRAGGSAELETLIVTAQRRSENIQDVPVSIQAISDRDIKALGIKSSTDVGLVTPNVDIALPSGAGSQPLISIRGVGLNDYDTNNAGPNGVYIDEVYISAPTGQTFAVFDLDQIEVLKGPQGTLYGRNTSGGAILFTSKKPTDTLTADLHLDYGAYNTYQAAAAVGGPITDDLSGRIAVVLNHSDGYFHNDLNGTSVNGTDNQALRLQLLYKPTNDLKVLFSSTIGYLNNLPTVYRHIGTYAPGTEGSDAPVVCSVTDANAGKCVDLFGWGTPGGFYRGSYNRTEHLRVRNLLEMLRVDYTLGRINLTSISAFQHSDKFHPEDSDASPDNLLQINFGVRSNTFTQEFRAAQNEKDFNWQAGVYYLYEDLHQDQPIYLFIDGDKFGAFGVPPGPGAFDGIAQIGLDNSTQITESVAVYGQGDYNLGAFTLTLGGRYTYERKTFDYHAGTRFQDGGIGSYDPISGVIDQSREQTASNFTWRAALAYHFTDRILGYASAATGFKSGVFNGSFLSSDPQQVALQLKPVRPEHITAYEVGVKSSFFDQRLIFNAAAFYNQYDDLQIFATVPQIVLTEAGPIETATQILTNAKEAHTEGVEVQITAAPIEGLTINLQPAWLNARIDHAGVDFVGGTVPLDGKQMAVSPHFSFAGQVDYKLAVGSDDAIDFLYSGAYKSHHYFDVTNDPYTQQGGYWVHSISVTYQNHAGWEVGGYVRNLSETKYYVDEFNLTSPFGLIEGIVGMPRTYGVRVGYHF